VIMETEKNILTLLVDAAAYYADQLSQDGTNADHLADGRELILSLYIRSFGRSIVTRISPIHRISPPHAPQPWTRLVTIFPTNMGS
jgi:hypothetical protein